MANNYFRFKQFTIYQDRCAMKVGTDGVLLGTIANPHNAHSILDIGTGTGLVALMLAQKNRNARITAIECDENAAAQAAENVSNSVFCNQIDVICQKWQDFAPACKQTFDLIVSNPPYFENSLKCPNEQKNMARHTDSLPFNELIAGISTLLSTHGKAYVIVPFAAYPTLRQEIESNQLFINALTYIKPTETKPIKRVVMAFSKNKTSAEETTLVIETNQRHVYTDTFKVLTQDFYL